MADARASAARWWWQCASEARRASKRLTAGSSMKRIASNFSSNEFEGDAASKSCLIFEAAVASATFVRDNRSCCNS
jgi:hypothetical protein